MIESIDIVGAPATSGAAPSTTAPGLFAGELNNAVAGATATAVAGAIATAAPMPSIPAIDGAGPTAAATEVPLTEAPQGDEPRITAPPGGCSCCLGLPIAPAPTDATATPLPAPAPGFASEVASGSNAIGSVGGPESTPTAGAIPAPNPTKAPSGAPDPVLPAVDGVAPFESPRALQSLTSAEDSPVALLAAEPTDDDEPVEPGSDLIATGAAAPEAVGTMAQMPLPAPTVASVPASVPANPAATVGSANTATSSIGSVGAPVGAGGENASESGDQPATLGEIPGSTDAGASDAGSLVDQRVASTAEPASTSTGSGPVGTSERAGSTANAGVMRSDHVRVLREMAPNRELQRLAIDLDGARVSVRVDHDVATVQVLSDPGHRLSGSWADDVQRSLNTTIRQEPGGNTHPDGDRRSRNPYRPTTDQLNADTEFSGRLDLARGV